MKNLKNAVTACLTLSLLSCLQLPLAARADDMPVLSAEQPTTDTQQVMPAPGPRPDGTQEAAGQHKTTVLSGEVKKRGKAEGGPDYDLQAQDNSAILQAQDNRDSLQAETGAGTDSAMFKLALQKLARRQTLTSEEYRSLKIGVIGMDSTRPFFQDEGDIDESYPGLPAYEAGIRVGDHEIFENVDDSQVKDPTRPMWMFTCGIAGETTDVIIRRGKDVHTYHLTRINMEDVADPKLRKMYERLVQKLGNQPGTYSTDEDPKTAKAASILKLLMKI